MSKENLIVSDEESSLAYENSNVITKVEVYNLNEISGNKTKKNPRQGKSNAVKTFNDSDDSGSCKSNATYVKSHVTTKRVNVSNGQNVNEGKSTSIFDNIDSGEDTKAPNMNTKNDCVQDETYNSKKTKKSKRKPRTKTKNICDDDKNAQETQEEKHYETEDILDKRGFKNDLSTNEVFALHIIKTDELLLDSYAFNVYVRIHLIDGETGEYIKKQNAQNLNHTYIEQLRTKASSALQLSRFKPYWNETIIINDAYDYFQSNPSLMVFFEIIETHESVEKIIAWAFLKARYNYEQNLRLHLFYPQHISTKGKCNSHNWWKKKQLRKYPSTLYVKLFKKQHSSKKFKTKVKQTIGESKQRFKENESTQIEGEIDESLLILTKNTILQKTYVPQEKLYELSVGSDGCLVHKFSNNGVYLACATSEDNTYYIIIFLMSDGSVFCKFNHHKGLIHDLSWSRDDELLISAASDNSVAIWDIRMQKLEYVLPHPSYVYCCIFQDSNIVATGCFDKHIRFWSLSSFTLVTELKEHEGYITSICFDKKNKLMYSADSTGCIIQWKKNTNSWSLKQTIRTLDCSNVIINQIILHRHGRRLIVNSRDGHIRLVDVETGYVLTTFTKGSKERSNLKCALTSCNSYLISGTESGDVLVWQADNGGLKQKMAPYNEHIAIQCIQFEANNNYLSVSHFGKGKSVLVYGVKSHINSKSLNDGQNTVREQHLNLTDLSRNMNNLEKGLTFRMVLKKLDEIITVT